MLKRALLDILEYNLSPEGYWWGASFNNYREKDSVAQKNSAEVLYKKTEKGIYCYLKISLKQLGQKFVLDKTLANVSAVRVLSGEKKYLSWICLERPEPDFHLPDIRATFSLKKQANNPVVFQRF